MRDQQKNKTRDSKWARGFQLSVSKDTLLSLVTAQRGFNYLPLLFAQQIPFIPLKQDSTKSPTSQHLPPQVEHWPLWSPLRLPAHGVSLGRSGGSWWRPGRWDGFHGGWEMGRHSRWSCLGRRRGEQEVFETWRGLRKRAVMLRSSPCRELTAQAIDSAWRIFCHAAVLSLLIIMDKSSDSLTEPHMPVHRWSYPFSISHSYKSRVTPLIM